MHLVLGNQARLSAVDVPSAVCATEPCELCRYAILERCPNWRAATLR